MFASVFFSTLGQLVESVGQGVICLHPAKRINFGRIHQRSFSPVIVLGLATG
ncbi:hypothetical protein [Mycolicibacterium sp.]|uniref:hypothetical protein n=1 Tax=Mycolicibacterium sp. TaxID=2320850 RepID=UPI0037CB3028